MKTTNKPNIGFWIISVIALIWNLMGVNQYIQQAYQTEEFRAMYSAEKLALINQTPAWATAAFAIAVFAGALGCIALLMRKKMANTLFIISFIAVVVQNIDAFMRLNFADFETFELVMTFIIPLFAIFLIWYSKKAIDKGWLN
ncbi:hypothetical protein [uncultured Flavobacterium sp.]|uniref:hypothetical protein n=1 Tax=uncultured Flavobacterium sp. TaxID=165435 RepID=UPI0030C8CA48